MANEYSKEERVAFEQMLEAFQDALVASRIVGIYRGQNAVDAERTSDQIWRPQPYIAQTFAGTDMTANFQNMTQLSVPATIGYARSAPWSMTATELRDALQEGRFGAAARQKLASDINVAVLNATALLGSLVVKRTAAASGFDDLAACEVIMDEQGVGIGDRKMALSGRDYNNMASNLAGRQTLAGKTLTAYEEAYIGRIAKFETFKMDYAYRLTAAAGVGVTVNGANQYYVPKATSTATTGEVSNVDNRFQVLTIAVTSGTVKAGDCFTIAGVNAVHHITKATTGQAKTFRIVEILTGSGGSGTVKITPPIISGGGSSQSELQYQNVDATPANGAVITFLNTVSALVNPFWHKDAIELLPSGYAVPTDAGAAVMKAATDQGIELVMQKQYDINTMLTKFRIDARYGVCYKQPEMGGIELFSQT